jgi:hypothetical protein
MVRASCGNESPSLAFKRLDAGIVTNFASSAPVIEIRAVTP